MQKCFKPGILASSLIAVERNVHALCTDIVFFMCSSHECTSSSTPNSPAMARVSNTLQSCKTILTLN